MVSLVGDGVRGSPSPGSSSCLAARFASVSSSSLPLSMLIGLVSPPLQDVSSSSSSALGEELCDESSEVCEPSSSTCLVRV